MIIKSFDLKKISNKNNIILIYGENYGLKNEINTKIKNQFSGQEINYEENDVLKRLDEFRNLIKNRSLFDGKKIITIKRCTEKIYQIIFEIVDYKMEDLIIIDCGTLDKRSKLRNFFEKSKKAVIIPTYKDDYQSLINISRDFFSQNKISISQETLSLLVSRCNGDRGYLKLELEKISNYITEKKNISLEEIYKLTNLYENYSATELVDSSLLKNVKKTCSILNESNYSQDDTFLIIRILLQKSKRILSLINEIDTGKNIDDALQEHRPPIFWKDKPIVKQQIKMWNYDKIKDLISKINSLEILIKKNNSLSIILLKNFIYEIMDTRVNSSF
tara:strand:+ start:4236 stop:5231 length:996 start_codon:yes stop_codon:yes gene_type:complete